MLNFKSSPMSLRALMVIGAKQSRARLPRSPALCRIARNDKKKQFLFFKTGICLFVYLFICLFLLPVSAQAAKFYLEPSNKVVSSGDQFSVDLKIDTQGGTINAADVHLVYPSSLIWIDSVSYTGALRMQNDDINKDNNRVVFHFGADSQGNRLNGNYTLATLTLSTRSSGEGYLGFVCDNSNDSDDTNIWEIDSTNDIVDCGSLAKAIYYVNPEIGGVSTIYSVCEAPEIPQNVEAISGPDSGQATLYWTASSNVRRYTITYGLSSGGYAYGADDIGTGTEYTVSGLTPGRYYYFVLTAVNNCGSSGYSSEVKARAAGTLYEEAVEEKGGWVANEPIGFQPLPEFVDYDATESAEATVSAQIEESPSPTPFIPPSPEAAEPFWRNWSFWAKAGALSAALFLLLLIASYIFNKLKKGGGGDDLIGPTPGEPESQPVDSGQWPPPPEPEQQPGQPTEVDYSQTQWPPQEGQNP